jgi:selenocysteine lyase/cysteine desulfurase
LICRLLHQHGAYSFIDYATLAPYAKINMNPNTTDYRDAIFISPHKFIGGPGCSGVLIMKRYLIKTISPYIVGGGTVEHVNFSEQIYSRNIEAREEGGTPNIVGNIK